MKASELKPGDYFRIPSHAYDPTRVYRYEGGSSVLVAFSGPNPSGRGVGERFPGALSGPSKPPCEVELVPMPGPYVIGKAYRTREGEKLFYRSPYGIDGSQFQHSHPHMFTLTPGLDDSYTATPDGRIGVHGEDHKDDIMGEWREEVVPAPVPALKLEVGKQYVRRDGKWYVRRDGKITGPMRVTSAPGFPVLYQEEHPEAGRGTERVYEPSGRHGYAYNEPNYDIVAELTPTTPVTGTITMNKRTLPTVTLDQLFETLQKHRACWIERDGLVATAARIQNLTAGKTVSARCLHAAILHGHLRAEDGKWLFDKCEAMYPADFKYQNPIGTPEFAKALDEWENPKTKEPRTFGELKVGQQFSVEGLDAVFMVVNGPDCGAKGYPAVWIKGSVNNGKTSAAGKLCHFTDHTRIALIKEA